MREYPFYFKIILYMEGCENPYHRQSGIGFCESMTDAVAQLEKYYGEEICNIIHLEMLESDGSGMLMLPDEVCQQYTKNSDSYGIPIPCTAGGLIVPMGKMEGNTYVS